MAVEWKDVTSYSRADKERIPKSFEAKVAGVRLLVTKHIDYPEGQWVLTAGGLIDKSIVPANTPVEQAQEACVGLVKVRLEEILAEIRG